MSVLAPGGANVYAGGQFGFIGGQVRGSAAAIDTASGLATSWNPQLRTLVGYISEIPPVVRALTVDGGRVYIGGYFNQAAGVPRRQIAAVDAVTAVAANWDPDGGVGSLSNPVIEAFEVHDGVVYVGGTFTNLGGQPRNGLAALDQITGAANAWNPNASPVHALAILGGRIYAGGAFTTIATQTYPGIACLIPIAAVDVVPQVTFEPMLRLGPNPTTGLTRLDFVLPSAGRVTIDVFDVQGRMIARPVDREFAAGAHRSSWNAAPHGPGLYFVRFHGGGRTTTRRVIAIP